MANIAIIGAGMAGVSALTALATRHKVTLFDKGQGSGGRMASKRLECSRWDMRAQFMRAYTQAFAQVLNTWQQAGLVAPWCVTSYMFADGQLRSSPDDAIRYVGISRMSMLSRLLLAPAAEFIAGVRIVHVQYQNKVWHLIDAKQNHYAPFEALVITCLPAQAAPLLAANLEVASVTMRPCWTLLLSFAHRLPLEANLIFAQQEPLQLLLRNSSKLERTGENWVLHASESYSMQHQNSPKEQVL